MRNSLLIIFCFGFICSKGAFGEDDLVIKKGTFPYMAFIYYGDPSVVNTLGERVMRAAILVRENWLITSALGDSAVNPDGFPQKTLLARVGAISIDGNFTLSEDEDEQEREVIQIVRPYNHSSTQWWTTDISLLKTLFPFNITKVVNFKMINEKRTFSEKTCIILFYAKLNNETSDKTLTQSFVEVMDPTIENCGAHFTANSMTCAIDKPDDANVTYNSEFCHGNSGGPLICEGEVMGLQSYIENQCREPHLYQLLSAWENFIICGMEDKCAEEQCGNICVVTNKDPLEGKETTQSTIVVPTLSTHLTSEVLTTAVPETVTPEGEIETTTTSTASTTEKELTPTTTTTTTTTSTTITTLQTTTKTEPPTTNEPEIAAETESSWPNVVSTQEEAKEQNVLIEQEREHRETLKTHRQVMRKKSRRSAAERSMCLVQTIVFGLVLCLF